MIPRFPGDPPRDLSRPLEELKLLIDGSHDGERLDKALSVLLPWRSRSSVQRLIADGRVDVGSRRPRPSQRLRAGDVVRIQIPPSARPEITVHEGVELDVLWEDRWMVAINKPAGMAVHPAGRTLSGTLIHHLHERYPRGDSDEHRIVPRLLHRIDRETSGVVAAGLDERFCGLVGRQFEDRLVSKTYLAVVHGCPEPREGIIDFGIGPDRASEVRLKQQARRDGSGLPALTRYRVQRTAGPYSLVELQPKTGRTHQIRVHMAALGHPLVGDKIYGPDERLFLDHLGGCLTEEGRARLILDRQALHAFRLRLYHPFDKRDVELEAPLPADMAGLLER